jgi:uncharacterized cupin superfamily protein
MNERAQALAAALVRNIHDLKLEHVVREPLYEFHGARLAKGTAARKLGCSYDEVPPGKRACPYHLHHAQEEMFVILEGSATLRVAGERLPLKAGDVVFTPAGPEYPHQIVNTGETTLKYLSISTREEPEICEYPDSDKYLARAGYDFARVAPRAHDLDYWEGEP